MNLGEMLRLTLPEGGAEALEALGARAAEAGLRLCIVGGCARDLAMGAQSPDIDLVLEGDAVRFAASAAPSLGFACDSHERFGVATLSAPGGLRVDIASARTETYSRPGALPDVSPGSIEDDLFRRDFTINAAAIELRPDRFGAVIDPFGGMKDIQAGIIKLLHGKSFIDDPTRLFRCARFSGRFDFAVEPETDALAGAAVASRAMETVSGERIKKELKLIFEERAPGRGRAVAACVRMELDEAVCDGFKMNAALFHPFDVAAESAQATASMAEGEQLSPWLAGLAAATLGATPDVARRLSHRLHATRDEEKVLAAAGGIDTAALRAVLSDERTGGAIVFETLEPLPIEALAALRAAAGVAARARIDDFLRRLRRVALDISGEDIAALGCAPGPRMGAVLNEILRHKRDGAVTGAEAELALARELLAARSGILE